MIRPFVTADARQLSAIHNSVFPDDPYSVVGFTDYVTGIQAIGGLARVIQNPRIAGYAIVAPVPGLPGVTELSGCIAPDQQRKGLGSRLLAGIVDELRETDMRQITYPVENLNTPAALFLTRNDFTVEHEEWLMVYRGQARAIEPHPDGEIAIQTLPRNTAVPLFCQLYERSFSDLPWYQPFTQEEVTRTLDSTHDLLFLARENEAVGVAWTRIDSEGKGIVEPLAIIPAYQGRGYGRYLLTAAMDVLQRRGVQLFEIGAWRDNRRAIHLYHSLGFRRHKCIVFLAYDLR